MAGKTKDLPEFWQVPDVIENSDCSVAAAKLEFHFRKRN